MARSVFDTINIIRQHLKALASPLADSPDYSAIYTLFRAIGQALTTQSDDLQRTYQDSFLYTASGSALDERARDFGFYRSAGSVSTGYVFATNPTPLELIQGTVLNTAPFSLQFTTNAAVTVNATGVYIPVTSTIRSEESNLDAGILLNSPFYPTVTFIVASSKNFSGAFAGPLEGGRPPETDVAFRVRVLAEVNQRAKGTLPSILSGLNSLNLPPFFLRENYPVPGYFTVLVNSRDSVVISAITQKLLEIKPIGVGFEVRPLVTIPIDLSFSILVADAAEAGVITSAIRSLCSNYVSSLSLGEVLYTGNFAVLAHNIQGLTSLILESPTATVLEAPQDSVFAINSVNFSISTRG